jgi:hypothetical protein
MEHEKERSHPFKQTFLLALCRPSLKEQMLWSYLLYIGKYSGRVKA